MMDRGVVKSSSRGNEASLRNWRENESRLPNWRENERDPTRSSTQFIGINFHYCSLVEALNLVENSVTAKGFRYIVTPNVDHVVRLKENMEEYGDLYGSAWLCLCDSKVMSYLALVCRRRIEVVRGSDLSLMLIERMSRFTPITVIGAEDHIINVLKRRYGFHNIAHYNPPMHFIADAKERAKCVNFVLKNPAHYVFFAVGSPQQEIIAHQVWKLNKAVGIGLCIGSSLRFIVGEERRAPRWIQHCGCEWLYRLCQDPHRLWRRYLVRCPRIFWVMAKHYGAMFRSK
jgi:N-acetylglucosaminyldiphosphoundecaprenol N-acetyl-beta-D-mannosaminyltransferase